MHAGEAAPAVAGQFDTRAKAHQARGGDLARAIADYDEADPARSARRRCLRPFPFNSAPYSVVTFHAALLPGLCGRCASTLRRWKARLQYVRSGHTINPREKRILQDGLVGAVIRQIIVAVIIVKSSFASESSIAFQCRLHHWEGADGDAGCRLQHCVDDAGYNDGNEWWPPGGVFWDDCRSLPATKSSDTPVTQTSFLTQSTRLSGMSTTMRANRVPVKKLGRLQLSCNKVLIAPRVISGGYGFADWVPISQVDEFTPAPSGVHSTAALSAAVCAAQNLGQLYRKALAR